MKRRLILTILFPFICGLILSCASLRSKPGTPGPATAAQTSTSSAPTSTYYDFDDIIIPKAMNISTEDSFVVESSGYKGGLLCFSGHVDPISLFDFFVSSMPADGWKLRNYFKYKRYMLLFEKPNKDCVIRINEKSWNTWLEIWVTPRPVQQEGN